jgi:hypothetical protein
MGWDSNIALRKLAEPVEPIKRVILRTNMSAVLGLSCKKETGDGLTLKLIRKTENAVPSQISARDNIDIALIWAREPFEPYIS